MLTDFETQLANLLGNRLAAPFAGRVVVAGNTPVGAGPTITVAVVDAKPLALDLGDIRLESTAGGANPKRVVKLQCTVEILIVPNAGGGRAQQMLAVDAILYQMDSTDLKSGAALNLSADTGFAIGQIQLAHAAVAADPTAVNAPPVNLTYTLDGWFWPVGVPAIAGSPIQQVSLRGAVQPLTFSPAAPIVKAGSAAFDIRIILNSPGSFALTGAGVQPAPATDVVVQLSGPGGKPGAGKITNTTPGAAGALLANLASGVATVTYQPPAASTLDTLIVLTDDGTGAAAQELGRMTIEVTS